MENSASASFHDNDEKEITTHIDVVGYLIKILSGLPGSIFIFIFIFGIIASMFGYVWPTMPFLVISMNVLFILMLVIKKLRRETFTLKDPFFGFATFFEVWWLIAMVNLL
ncbi:MAG: hypothetical protein ABIO57_03010 [Candidatus Paceibacterota bacterium]